MAKPKKPGDATEASMYKLTGVSGSLTGHTDPPLGGSQGGRVDDKLVGGTVVRGRGLQSSQVGRVSELSLSRTHSVSIHAQ